MNRLILLVLLAILPAAATAQDAEWLIAPYAWVPDIGLSQSSGGGGGISGSDLLDKTDAAGMIRVEAAKGRWGVSVDYLWLGLSDERTESITDPIPANVTVRGELDLGAVELAGMYRPTGEADGLSLLFGMRYISSEKTVLVIFPPPVPTDRVDDDTSVTDVILGARYTHRIGQRWDLNLRGDYGFGDSDGTLNLVASAGFRFNDVFAIQLGYRYMDLEYKDASSDTVEIELSGPFLGLVFRF